MALGQGKQSQPASGSGQAYPIAKGFAFLILAALIALFVLRHLFGSIRIDVGTR